MNLPGSVIPIHQSLTQPLLLAGAPRTLAILNGTVAAAVTLGLQSLYALPACLAIHLISVALAKKDPYFLQVLTRSLHKKSYYNV